MLHSRWPSVCYRRWRKWHTRVSLHLSLLLASLTLLSLSATLFLRLRPFTSSTSPSPGPIVRMFLNRTVDIPSQPFARNIIVSELNRLIFCPVPKAANSNWKYLLRKWEGLSDFADLSAAHSPLRSKMRYLSDYSAAEAARLLANPDYFRFVFVRDPYTRLVSCYMDKFRNSDPEYVHREYRGFLAQLFSWHYARTVDIEHDPRPEFRAFVDELLKHDHDTMNAHWRPQTLLCGFGIVPYDFVGKMEHLSRDVEFVFGRIGRPAENFPSHADINFPPSGTTQQVIDNLYTTDLMLKVRALYDDDFRYLDYT